jgi:glycosyltransferase involved in cell wall biosynthesis
MHIAFFSPAWPLAKSHNGIVTYVHWMKLALEREGHRVSVFTFDCVDPEPNVYPVSRRPPVLRRLARRLARGLTARRSSELDVFDLSAAIAAAMQRVARGNPIDIIEMEESFGWCADVARRTSLPLIVRLHGPAFLSLDEGELETPSARSKIEREGLALRACPVVTSPTQRTLTQTIERYRLRPRHSLHIVNPLAMHADAPLWRLERCDRNMILFVGRFDLRKGADVALTAFRTVLKTHPHAKLTFVGPDIGLPSPGGGRIRLEQYCHSLFPVGLRDRVDYRGPMANQEIAKLRAQALVTVVASRWENPGYTMLEAMLQGCPLVCSDAGGCPESVIPGITGRLAKSANPDDFAAQLCATMDDPRSAQRVGEAARQLVLAKHSPDRVAAASMELYERIIA